MKQEHDPLLRVTGQARLRPLAEMEREVVTMEGQLLAVGTGRGRGEGEGMQRGRLGCCMLERKGRAYRIVRIEGEQLIAGWGT